MKKGVTLPERAGRETALSGSGRPREKGAVFCFFGFDAFLEKAEVEIESVEDKGFQGLQKLHANSTIPVKVSKNHKLTKEEKKLNREISKRRIEIEHINRYIKHFHILSYRYRNKRKRFALRASLICGIYNFQHAS